MQDPSKRPVMPGANPNHASEIDWTSMFQPGASDGYMNPVFPQSMASGQEPIHAHVDADRKFYPASTGPQEGGGMNGLYLASTTLSGDGTHNSPGISHRWFRLLANIQIAGTVQSARQ